MEEPEDKQIIQPGHIYIAPQNYHLLIEGDHFALSTEAPVWYARPSIDVLFESAADAYGEKVIGIVLTGTNEDGAQGLAAIKKRGGLAGVQDPKTAESPRIPEVAIEATKAFIHPANFLEPVLVLLQSSVLFIGMAVVCGLRVKSGKGLHFISHCRSLRPVSGR